VPFGNLKAGCHVPLTESWPLYHKGLIGGVLQGWLSSWKVLPFLTEELRHSVRGTIGFFVTFLTKALFPIAQFCWAASSRKRLGGSKLLIAKGLNTYVNMVCLKKIVIHQEKCITNLFSLCHYGVLCVD
jgi:hypothetical protein